MAYNQNQEQNNRERQKLVPEPMNIDSSSKFKQCPNVSTISQEIGAQAKQKEEIVRAQNRTKTSASQQFSSKNFQRSYCGCRRNRQYDEPTNSDDSLNS